MVDDSRQRAWLLRLEAFNARPRGRAITAVVITALVLVLYHSVNALSSGPGQWLYTSWDAAIPFWPWTMTLYASLYLLLPLAAVVVEGREFLLSLLSLLVAAIVCCVIFMLAPADYPRPDLAQVSSPFWRGWMEAAYAGDGASNTFPSIHVAAATLLAVGLRGHRFRALWWTWCVAIALSTLTVKQHFIADVVAGVAVALAVRAAVVRAWPTPEADRGSP